MADLVQDAPLFDLDEVADEWALQAEEAEAIQRDRIVEIRERACQCGIVDADSVAQLRAERDAQWARCYARRVAQRARLEAKAAGRIRRTQPAYPAVCCPPVSRNASLSVAHNTPAAHTANVFKAMRYRRSRFRL